MRSYVGRVFRMSLFSKEAADSPERQFYYFVVLSERQKRSEPYVFVLWDNGKYEEFPVRVIEDDGDEEVL